MAPPPFSIYRLPSASTRYFATSVFFDGRLRARGVVGDPIVRNGLSTENPVAQTPAALHVVIGPLSENGIDVFPCLFPDRSSRREIRNRASCARDFRTYRSEKTVCPCRHKARSSCKTAQGHKSWYRLEISNMALDGHSLVIITGFFVRKTVKARILFFIDSDTIYNHSVFVNSFFSVCCQQIELSGFVANELSAFPLPSSEKDNADTAHRSAITPAIIVSAMGISFIFSTFRFERRILYIPGHERRTLRYGLDFRLNLISLVVIVCQPSWAVKDGQVAIRIAVYPYFDLDVVHTIVVGRDL